MRTMTTKNNINDTTANRPTKFYHGTSLENWKKIQEEGILFGVIQVWDNEFKRLCPQYHPSRCTYLTPMISEARCYGDVILEVEYDTTIHPKLNNYVDLCWQFRVYEPIPLSNVKRIK